MMESQAELLRNRGLDVETVGEIMDGPEASPAAIGPFKPPVLDGTPELPAPGIYFNMPDELYHSLPALSSSGIKKLASSPMLFWASTTWLNEECAKQKAEAEKDKDHLNIGKAYHCRILEGREAYERRFVVALDKASIEGCLESSDEIKNRIRELGEKPLGTITEADGISKRAAKKEDWINQLLELEPDARIMARIVEEFEEEHRGKTVIPADVHMRIELAARMIQLDEGLCKAFTGGHPEVVLIWNCPRTGVPMKARVDYLKIRAMVDLKSIANQRERSIENAIRFEIASYHYNIQPSVYFEGADEVRKLVRKHGASVVHGLDDPTWALQWARHQEPDKWLWVFQQKGIAPITRGAWYPRAGTVKMISDDIVLRMKRRFREYAESMGMEPWLDVAPPYELADEDIPNSATEI